VASFLHEFQAQCYSYSQALCGGWGHIWWNRRWKHDLELRRFAHDSYAAVCGGDKERGIDHHDLLQQLERSEDAHESLLDLAVPQATLEFPG
jgi:hypothetical protein